VPPGLWTLDAPVEFEHALLLKGHFGKFYSSDLYPTTVIRGSSNLAGRPMFHRKGFYLSHDDVWTTSAGKPADLVQCAAVGCGLTVQVEDIAFQSLHEDSCILQVYNASNPTYVKNCSFGQAFRGLMMVNTFGAVVENCAFQGQFRYPWLNDLQRVKRGWGLVVGNNVTITQCNWQGGLVGLQCIGTGNQVIGGRIERNIYGLRLGFKNLNPDVAVFPGPDYATSFSTFTGITFESNLCGIDARLHAGSRLSECCVTGTNSPQLDGVSDGPCDYGIDLQYQYHPTMFNNCVVSGDFKRAAILGTYSKDANITETNNLKVVA
jgi:hypothetical protein